MERVLLILKTESKPVGGFIWGCSIYRADTGEKNKFERDYTYNTFALNPIIRKILGLIPVFIRLTYKTKR